MSKSTHYDTLGLDRQAPAAQIKSQYRRLAKRYHPDLNPGNAHAAQQFLEVKAAYDTLSNPDKRREYDFELGEPPAEAPATQYPWQAGKHSYRRYDGRPRQRPRQHRPVMRPHQPRAAYSHYVLDLSLPELFKGVRRSITVGQTFTCGRCRGRGKLDNGLPCQRCGSYGFVVNYQQIEVMVPPGLQPGMNIRLELANNGSLEDTLLDAPVMTDIALTLRLRETPPFEYRDHQLYTTASVPSRLLNEGGEWTIPAPEGGELTFKIPAETLSGTMLTLRKRGLRNGTSQRRGNLFCTVIAQSE